MVARDAALGRTTARSGASEPEVEWQDGLAARPERLEQSDGTCTARAIGWEMMGPSGKGPVASNCAPKFRFCDG